MPESVNRPQICALEGLSARPSRADERQVAPMADDALRRVDRTCRLLDIYGGLLTERQRLFCEQHFAEDLSFGEIAREQNISRQAVHDTVKNALALLDHYEGQLRLLAQEDGAGAGTTAEESDGSDRSIGQGTAGQAAAPISGGVGGISPQRLAAAREALEDLRLEIKRRGGAIYDGHAFARQLEAIEEMLTPE